MKNIRLMGATALQSAIVIGAFGFAQTAYRAGNRHGHAVTTQVEDDGS